MLSYKDSVIAPKDITMAEWYFHVDDDIGTLRIEDVLMCLCHNDHGFKKQMPTKAELRAALQKIKRDWLNTISEDFDFYAEHIIPKFLEVSK
jgi:hypothetical protein